MTQGSRFRGIKCAMCDDPSHAILAAEVSRLQEDNARLESLVNRPVYVTVTPPTATYKPPDPNLSNIGANLATIAMHLSVIATEVKVGNIANGIS